MSLVCVLLSGYAWDPSRIILDRISEIYYSGAISGWRQPGPETDQRAERERPGDGQSNSRWNDEQKSGRRKMKIAQDGQNEGV